MHIKVMGTGPDLVMLHGWSMHSGVWHQFAELLSQHFTLHMVDLPGHGQSAWSDNAFDMDGLVEQLSEQLPTNAHWLGWSLGGLIATAFVNRFPTAVKKLILLASTPLFVQKNDWPCAVSADVFSQFSDNLALDQQQTLKRFLMLQARGAEQSRATITQLANDLAATTPPHSQALKEGLTILLTMDKREVLAALNCPIMMLLGDRDTLVPSDMLPRAAALNSQIQTVKVLGAGHAPFISQPQQCAEHVREFINA